MAFLSRKTTRSRARAFLAAATVGLGLLLGMPTAAHAAPNANDLAKQIDAEWQKLEPLLENWDLLNDKLQTQEKQANKLEQQLEPLQLQVQVKLARVGQIAASVYMSGPHGTLSMLINSGATEDTLNLLGEFEQVANAQQADVADAVALEKEYEAKAAPLNAEIASLKQQQDALNQQKASLQKQIDQLDTERRQVYGKLYDLSNIRPAPCPYTYDGSPGAKAAKWACNQIGKPYVFGAAGPKSFDCSGLTMAAWATVGVSMPHNAYAQDHTFKNISRSQLEVGDLVFYYHPISHVTIYVGNGWVVSAPATGEVVKMKRMDSPTPAAYARP